MILCYRGTYYCSPPLIIEKAETGMTAKYREVSYQIQPQCLKVGSQREMNLKYRGVAYTVARSVIEEAHRLVFPGYRFLSRRRWNMKLIYRGHIYDYTPAPVLPYCKPRALNWRYCYRGEQYECTSVPIQPYRKPRALNWRYQFSADM